MERELTLPELAFSASPLSTAYPLSEGYPLPGANTGDGIVWERDRCEAFPIESDTMFIEIKVQVVKAVLLPMLGQVVGVVRYDVQEETRLGIVWAASVPDVV